MAMVRHRLGTAMVRRRGGTVMGLRKALTVMAHRLHRHRAILGAMVRRLDITAVMGTATESRMTCV